jgi:hypothetical protein
MRFVSRAGACCALSTLGCVAGREASPSPPSTRTADVADMGADAARTDAAQADAWQAKAAGAPATEGDAVEAGTAKAGSIPTITGQLLTRYRGRFTGDESDHDLYETVDLALTDPGGRWTGAVLARAAWDLDGREDGQDDFFSLQDTYDHSFETQLLHAYVDVNTGPLSLLRLGRQELYETPVTVLLDGVRAETEPWGSRRAMLGVYGGQGEHPYESSSEGDLTYGAFGSLSVWSGAELRADWMRLEDARLGVDHENDLFGLVLSQDIVGENRATRFDARFTTLENDGRDVRLTGSHVDSRANFTLQGSLYKLLQTQTQLAAPLDPFSDTLFELFPYYQLGLSASKDWSAFSLLSGLDVRRVEEDSDVGEFNRDFERYYLTGTLPDALPVTVSMTGELWHATDTDFETWGASLARAFDRNWDATLGSYYALYEYDLMSGEERDHVRTTYLDLRWKTGPGRRWGLRYEFERNDIDDYHDVRVEYAWNF